MRQSWLVICLLLVGCSLAPKQAVIPRPPSSQPASQPTPEAAYVNPVQQGAGGVVTQLQGDVAAIKTTQNFSVTTLVVLVILCVGLGYFAIWTSHRRGMKRLEINGEKTSTA